MVHNTTNKSLKMTHEVPVFVSVLFCLMLNDHFSVDLLVLSKSFSSVLVEKKVGKKTQEQCGKNVSYTTAA